MSVHEVQSVRCSIPIDSLLQAQVNCTSRVTFISPANGHSTSLKNLMGYGVHLSEFVEKEGTPYGIIRPVQSKEGFNNTWDGLDVSINTVDADSTLYLSI